LRRWAKEQGSDQLNIGIEDGYRMIPQYLLERINAEVPGFYAHLPRDNDDVSWQERTAPSIAALRLRRAVQERLERWCPEKMDPPDAQIVWMKSPPIGMREKPEDEDEWYHEDPAFEAIIARNWLGRYTLVAAVHNLQ